MAIFMLLSELIMHYFACILGDKPIKKFTKKFLLLRILYKV